MHDADKNPASIEVRALLPAITEARRVLLTQWFIEPLLDSEIPHLLMRCAVEIDFLRSLYRRIEDFLAKESCSLNGHELHYSTLLRALDARLTFLWKCERWVRDEGVRRYQACQCSDELWVYFFREVGEVGKASYNLKVIPILEGGMASIHHNLQNGSAERFIGALWDSWCMGMDHYMSGHNVYALPKVLPPAL